MIAPLSCDWQPAALVVPSVDRHLGRLVPGGQLDTGSHADHGNHMYTYWSSVRDYNPIEKKYRQYRKLKSISVACFEKK